MIDNLTSCKSYVIFGNVISILGNLLAMRQANQIYGGAMLAIVANVLAIIGFSPFVSMSVDNAIEVFRKERSKTIDVTPPEEKKTLDN